MRAQPQQLLSLSAIPFYALLVLHVSAAATKGTQQNVGVVVEDVQKQTEAERAGFQKGDVILGWIRRGQRHEISSPFDLEWIETADTGHIAIRLDGLQNGREQSWVLSNGFGNLTCIPRYAEFISLHATVTQLARNKRFDEIARAYDTLAGAQSLPPDVRVWTLVDGARTFINAHESGRADLLFQRVSQLSAQASLIAQSRVLEARATFLEAQREFDRSAGVLHKAFEINEKLAPAGLACAGDLVRPKYSNMLKTKNV